MMPLLTIIVGQKLSTGTHSNRRAQAAQHLESICRYVEWLEARTADDEPAIDLTNDFARQIAAKIFRTILRTSLVC